MSARTVRVALAFLPACAASLVGIAAAAEKDECIGSADRGQQLRDDGHYALARQAFSQCAQQTCPALVQHDCAGWLLDLDERSATVVVSAKDDRGADLVDVRVDVDGVVIAEKLDGKPMSVDPGEHLMRYEATGFGPVEQRIVVHAAEKNRILDVRLESLKAVQATPLASTTPTAAEATAARSQGTAGVPLPAWIFAGTSAVAFATEAIFGISGVSQRGSDLGPGGCAPHCASSERSDIQTKFAIADVSLGVGVASAGVAAYFFFFRPRASSEAKGVAVDLRWTKTGGTAAVAGHF